MKESNHSKWNFRWALLNAFIENFHKNIYTAVLVRLLSCKHRIYLIFNQNLDWSIVFVLESPWYFVMEDIWKFFDHLYNWLHPSYISSILKRKEKIFFNKKNDSNSVEDHLETYWLYYVYFNNLREIKWGLKYDYGYGNSIANILRDALEVDVKILKKAMFLCYGKQIYYFIICGWNNMKMRF